MITIEHITDTDIVATLPTITIIVAVIIITIIIVITIGTMIGIMIDTITGTKGDNYALLAANTVSTTAV